MADLIDRNAAIDEMAELQGRASTKAELTGISKAWKRLRKLPTVEVVRCDDCKHRHMCYREVATVNEVLTTVMYERVEFCSRGERE